MKNLITLLGFTFLLGTPFIVLSQWSQDSEVNNVISYVNGKDQEKTGTVSDGEGGAIIAWEDHRNNGTSTDIYAQRIDINGINQWTENGVLVSNAVGAQDQFEILSDGSGGAIIVWEDNRTGGGNEEDIYAQRIDANGNRLWEDDNNSYNGIPVCAWDEHQGWLDATLSSDGNLIVTWQDDRNNLTTARDVYAAKIDISTGSHLWTENGILVCNAENNASVPVLVADDQGGAIITWQDNRDGSNNGNIYAHKVSDPGILPWAGVHPQGVPICTELHTQRIPAINTDGMGGAYIAWTDERNWEYDDIFVQRINGNGVVYWEVDGLEVVSSSFVESAVHILPSLNNEVLILWKSYGNGTYAQRILPSGLRMWNGGGVYCGGVDAKVVASESGGAFLTWAYLNVIMAQEIAYASGARLWADTIVCDNNSNYRRNPSLANSEDGIIVSWEDSRNNNYDHIYASKLPYEEILPVVLAEFVAYPEEHFVRLDWVTESELNHSHFMLERSHDGKDFIAFHREEGKGTATISSYSFLDRETYSGDNYYRLKQVDLDGTYTYSDIVYIEINKNFDLQVYPNPAEDWIFVNTEKEEINSIEIYTVNGQMVRAIPTSSTSRSKINISALNPGMYFIKGANSVSKAFIKSSR